MTDPADDAAYLERVSDELDSVEAALDRVDTGAFGKCQVCGADIEEFRLQADPIATRCEAHAQAHPNP